VLVGLLVTLACVHAAFRTAAPLTVTFSNDTGDEIFVNGCVVNSPLFVEPRSTAVLVLGEERPLVCALQVSTRGGLFGTIRCIDVPIAHRGHAHLAATAAERVRRGSPCSPWTPLSTAHVVEVHSAGDQFLEGDLSSRSWRSGDLRSRDVENRRV